VIRVVRNRMSDPRFPGDACAVIAQAGQFQPVTESAVLRQVARDPEGYSIPQVLGARSPGARRLLASAHRLARAPQGSGPDPTGGALYFVNPAFMDPANCPWFAGLRRTARIGSHVFMMDRGVVSGAGPALDCAAAGSGRDVAAGGVSDS
jgi:spore germination cell wall hydrolase CwlJ-like protein